MESFEEMKKRLASMQEQKITAEKASDTEFANELSDDITELIKQMDSLIDNEPTPLPEPTTTVTTRNEVAESALRKAREILGD